MAAQRWLQITVAADPALIEPISDFMMGVLGAAVEAAAKDEPGYGTINGFIQEPDPKPAEVEQILGRVEAYLQELQEIFGVATPRISHKIIEDEDWGKSWKEHFTPFAIVPGLMIVPTWEEYHPAEGELVITMDPGMAFGTGHHATTSLSLEFIRDSLAGSDGKTLLDVGTGTGILGMSALLYGAKRVLATDNDPEAVRAALENVELNNTGGEMAVSQASLEEISEPYDIVVANIVHDVLVSMAADLVRLVKRGGDLILSGILVENQLGNIVRIFKEQGLESAGEKVRDEWSAIRLKKK